jgi:hypothetical protein
MPHERRFAGVRGVEWFKSSKRTAVAPAIPADAGTAGDDPDAVAVSESKSPKAVFDSVADQPRIVRPLPARSVGFTISSSRNGESGELQLTSPTLTVAKARMLFKSGWRVQVTNAAGRQFAPSEFDEILRFD